MKIDENRCNSTTPCRRWGKACAGTLWPSKTFGVNIVMTNIDYLLTVHTWHRNGLPKFVEPMKLRPQQAPNQTMFSPFRNCWMRSITVLTNLGTECWPEKCFQITLKQRIWSLWCSLGRGFSFYENTSQAQPERFSSSCFRRNMKDLKPNPKILPTMLKLYVPSFL